MFDDFSVVTVLTQLLIWFLCPLAWVNVYGS